LQNNLSKALARVPGMVIRKRQNYAQHLQISSRGFGVRSTFGVRCIRVIADDTPAAMPGGQGQGATIDLSSAQRIEVLRGPLAVTYGNSSGGIIHAFSEDGPATPMLGASVFAGSAATRKIGMKADGTSGAVNYLVNVSRFETDGYRDHSAAARDHFNSTECRKGYNNFLGSSLGVIGAQRRDEDDKVASFDQYLPVDWRATEILQVIAGLRSSEVKFDLSDFYIAPGNGDDSGAKNYRNINPTPGVPIEATDSLNLYGNAGHGFETPTFAALACRPTGETGINFALDAAKKSNLEVGANWRVNDYLRATLAWFEITTSNEITLTTSSGGRSAFQNAGRSTRRGMEIGADAKLPADIPLMAAQSWLDVKFDESFSFSRTVQDVTTVRTVCAGNALAGVPKKTAYVDLGWRKEKTRILGNGRGALER
jgi:outer membrane receptor protein involved in Fe transport